MGSPKLPALGKWCERHARWECTKNRTKGRGPCHGAAITGTDACPNHSGKSIEQARKDAVTAWSAVAGDDGITPRAAVSAHLALTWRRSQMYGELLQRQVEVALLAAPEPNHRGPVDDEGERGEPQFDAEGGDGPAGSVGLIGFQYSADDAAGGIYATGEKVRALVELERHERELLLKFAAEGHKMGIEERAQWLAEQHAAGIAAVLRLAARNLGWDIADQAVGVAVAAAIRELSGARPALQG